MNGLFALKFQLICSDEMEREREREKDRERETSIESKNPVNPISFGD